MGIGKGIRVKIMVAGRKRRRQRNRVKRKGGRARQRLPLKKDRQTEKDTACLGGKWGDWGVYFLKAQGIQVKGRPVNL